MATSTDAIGLLFRLRGDASGLKTLPTEAKAVVAQLRQSFGPELAASIGVGQKALESIGASVENLVSQRLPLLGNVAVSVSSGLRQISAAASESRASVDGTGLSFAEIGATIGRTEAQVAGFVASLGLLKTEAARNTAVVGFLGGALASNLRPQLDEAAKAGTELNRIFQASGKSTNEALRLVQTLGLIGDASQRNAAAVAFFGETTARKLLPQLERFGASLGVIAAASGRSGTEVAEFVARFARLGTEVEKRTAAVEFFGASLATKLGPELTKTSAALAGVSAESAAAGSALAGIAAPVAIAALALAAVAAAAVIVSKEIFQLSKQAAEFQGRMFDLSQQTGIAVETLSALEIVAKTTGGEIGNITQALITFQRRLDDTSDPASKAAAQFKELGIQATDTETGLRQAFAALARMPEGFQQTNAAAELFGTRGGKQILAILKETNGDLDGAIRRFRELGILIEEGDARAADRFNDELELLNFQIRSLSAVIARDIIPELTGLIRGFSDLLRAIKPVLSLIGPIASANVRLFASSLTGLRLVVHALTLDYQGLRRAIKEVNEEEAKRKNIPPQTTEGPQPVSLPGETTPQQQAQEAAAAADVVVASIKRTTAARNQILEELFEQGRINRQKQVDETIESNRQILKAETDRIDALVAAKQKEFKAIDRERLSKQEVAEREQRLRQDADKLNQERLDKEAEFERDSTRLRARAAQERADSRRQQIDNETNILIKEFERQIKSIEAALERGEGSTEQQLATIEALEKAKIDARIEGLEAQKQVGFLTIQEAEDLNQQIRQLNQERDQLEDDQRQRRLLRERKTAEQIRDIQLANIDALLEVERIRAERLITANESLAEARILSEEDAARRILAIRLQLINSEIEATESRLKAASTITDADERVRTQAELNNQIKILTEQRTSVQATGERAIEDGRQRDLENERRYAEELRSIRDRIVDIQRDAARTVIDLMEARFARRRDIIRAEAELEVRDAEDRLRRNREDIRREREAVNERIAGLRGFLTSLESSTQAEIAAYARLVQARIATLTQQRELNTQERTELEQHQSLLAALRERNVIGGFRSVIEARVSALERQRDLNDQERTELAQHQEILQALREREARAARVGVIEARVAVLEQQKSLNDEEQEELRRHQAELQRIREQDSDLTSAIQRRVDFLNSQTSLNAQEQNELKRHVATLKVISEGGQSFEVAIRARIGFLEGQSALNAEEQAELAQHKAILIRLEDRSGSYENALQKRIEFLEQQKELNAEEKAELERHEAELELIRRRARLAEKEADPIGRISLDIDNLKEFARVLEDSIVPLGDILAGTFHQVADAIGQTVSNWVLLGETGPAVMRKILAQALASVAAEAAVNAIKELALGFATLFFNPAESAAHFAAAGLWASIGGVAAVAGRTVAGDLFKPKGSTAGGAGRGGAGSGRSGEASPIDLTRPQQTQELHIFLHGEPGPRFNDAVISGVVDSVRSNGPMRMVIKNVAEG